MELAVGPLDIQTTLHSLALGSVSGNLIVAGGDQANGIIATFDASADYAQIRNWTTPNVTQNARYTPDESQIISTDNTGKVFFWNTDGTQNSTLTPTGTVEILY